MNVQIDEKRQNPLMERLEVKFTVVHGKEATPSREEIRSSLASALKAEKEKIIVDHLDTEFGRHSCTGYAKVYDSVESARKLEKDHLLVRHGLKEKESGKKGKK